MPRKPKPRKIGTAGSEAMNSAVSAIIQEGYSLRVAADRFNVKYPTLFRYVKKKQLNPNVEIKMEPNYAINRIFPDDEEQLLAEYIMTCSKMAYGLTTVNVRKLAYECAVHNGKKIPRSWIKAQAAGSDWLRAFMKRCNNLSIRKPEACSLTRLTSFNKHNVQTFFTNLRKILERYPEIANGSRIYNLDETGTTTVHAPKRIVTVKGVKQVSSCTSGERGQLVTTCAIISALGSHLPPVMVFPRVHFKDHMLHGAPPGTLGLTNPSGWMSTELFPKVLDHFIKHSGSSKDMPTLLIFDNHESHISIEVVEKARSAGVHIVTLPPHCSHKLQPLDVAVFGPFKAQYNAACESWLLNHPGTPLTIYNVAQCVGDAHSKSFTPANIISGFKKTGIHPYDDTIFTETDFLSSAVTDRTYSNENNPGTSNENTDPHAELTTPIPGSNIILDDSVDRQENHDTEDVINEPNRQVFISPEQFRGFPKAQPRKLTRKPRQKGRSAIITDSPEKIALAEKEEAKLQRTKKKVKVPNDLKMNNKKFSKPTKKRQLSDSSDSDVEVHYDSEDSNSEVSEPELDEPILTREAVKDDFVLVRFPQGIHYIGHILTNIDGNRDYEVSYLRLTNKFETHCFYYPQEPDLALVNESDIKLVLPQPEKSSKTKRLARYLKFRMNFGVLNIK